MAGYRHAEIGDRQLEIGNPQSPVGALPIASGATTGQVSGMSFHSHLVFALALFIAVATPGPGILAVVSCAVSRGFREALGMTAGLVLGDLAYFTLAATGLAAMARSMGDLFLVVKFAGAAYLIWLGVKLWRARAARADEPADPTRVARGFGRNLMAGLLVTLGNPKVIAFYAGLLPTFVDLETLTLGSAAIMMATMVLVVGGVPTAYALAASRARRFLRDERRLRLMNRTAGTMMIGAGIKVAVQ